MLPRSADSRATIQTARQMGVAVKMVTRHQIAIRKEIARQLGLGTNILDACLIGETRHHHIGQLDEAIVRADGFAQVFPEHKTTPASE